VVEAGSDDVTYCQAGKAKDGQPVIFYLEGGASFVKDTSGSDEDKIQDLIQKFNVYAIPNRGTKEVIFSYDNKFRMDIGIPSSIVIVIARADNLNLLYAEVLYSASQRTNIPDHVVRRALGWSLDHHQKVRVPVGYEKARRSDGNDIPPCSSGLKLRSLMPFYLASIVFSTLARQDRQLRRLASCWLSCFCCMLN
jgi:hypothetical protein